MRLLMTAVLLTLTVGCNDKKDGATPEPPKGSGSRTLEHRQDERAVKMAGPETEGESSNDGSSGR